MNVEISKAFTFESAHRLPLVPPTHKCFRLHGHSYKVTITLKGEVTQQGWLVDFAQITEIFEPLRQRLDHYYLNEIEGLDNPTSELLAKWIWEHLVGECGELLYCVAISETCMSECKYYGN